MGERLYLKRLEVYGFKSFATRSVLDFEHENSISKISAVVGPNGSGKSNIVDAVRWVLGEQSSKLLRSKKNEDVIFCGSASKPRGSYAEIAMTLAGQEAVEVEINNKKYHFNEIEVARKLYRSGESEYLINRKKVRLVDLQQLLATLGFGQSSYTVLGQGMVDRLLFFNASERKVLFDEAAGVKQYEIKREQAIKKLVATDGNIVRLRDILTELEPRVANLRRLVKRAEGRKEIETELRSLQEKYYGSVLFEYDSRLSSLKNEKIELNKKVIQNEKEIALIDQKIEELTASKNNEQALTKLEAEVTTATNSRDELMKKVAFIEGQLNQTEQKIQAARSGEQALVSEQKTLEGKIEFLEQKIAEEKKARDTEVKEKQQILDQIGAVEEKRASLAKRLESAETTKDAKNQAVLETKLGELEAEKRKIAAEILEINQKNFLDKAREEDRQKRKTEVASRIEEKSQQIVAIEKEIESKQSEIEKNEVEIAKLEKKSEDVIKQVAKQEKELFEVSPEEVAEIDKEIMAVSGDFTAVTAGKTSIVDFLKKIDKLFGRFRKITGYLNKEKRSIAEKSLATLRKEDRELGSQINSYRFETEKAINRINNLLEQKKGLEEEISGYKDEVKSFSAEKNFSNSEVLTRLEKELPEVETEIKETSERLKSLVKGVNEIKQEIFAEKNELHEEEAKLRRKEYEIALNINRQNSLLDNQGKELVSAKNRLVEVGLRLNDLKNSHVTTDSSLSRELEREKSELEKKNSDLTKLRVKLSDALASQRSQNNESLDLERKRRGFEYEIGAVKDKVSDLDLEETKFLTRKEDLEEEMRLGQINVKVGSAIINQSEKDSTRIKMENLRRRLETIGNVDPETQTEFEEMETRSTEMTKQLTDLATAKSDLEKVIKELDEKIKKQFARVFEHIAKEFNRYFEILFNGGKANLTMGEDEEGNYGIEISATPPGKRVQSLNALSGGERTLTSMALLFAILSINPSPFCVLDEVDAALDESNTVRFTKILNDLSKKTQFIVISHNRETMKAADTLYGVTMDTDHVSKLISVKLIEALEAVK